MGIRYPEQLAAESINSESLERIATEEDYLDQPPPEYWTNERTIGFVALGEVELNGKNG